MSLDGLTYKQRLFVEAYLGPSNGNASDAARRAGYKNPALLGHRLVKKSAISAAISARLDSAALTTNQILAILSDQATVSVEDFGHVSEHGYTLDLDKARKRGRMHCIKKLKPVRVQVDDGEDQPAYRTEYEIELHNSQTAIELLGKYRGMWAGDLGKPEASNTEPPATDGNTGEPVDA